MCEFCCIPCHKPLVQCSKSSLAEKPTPSSLASGLLHAHTHGVTAVMRPGRLAACFLRTTMASQLC